MFARLRTQATLMACTIGQTVVDGVAGEENGPAERDAAAHGGGGGGGGNAEDRIGEMEDELYEVRSQLEEEQDRVRELEGALQAAKAQAGGANSNEMMLLRQDLEDMRDEKERAERLLANALGQG